ncbi:hypothetical protein GCM10011371_14180 [Novosphingobium marinum]|uniref:Uncharacterized protein n=1 Tax=Novosphingobium marinum TaxID=1514948 RepID=A0A7Y9XVY3_9SPHN|nr:hypothetical protein [Novosphingobium marinum]GGC27800.1 hypothetical protein GCM10011371_14180 [Novosphingobium marinum]
MELMAILDDSEGGHEAIECVDMGCGSAVLTQTEGEYAGDRIVMSWGQLLGAVEALRPVYGDITKNTEPADMALA